MPQRMTPSREERFIKNLRGLVTVNEEFVADSQFIGMFNTIYNTSIGEHSFSTYLTQVQKDWSNKLVRSRRHKKERYTYKFVNGDLVDMKEMEAAATRVPEGLRTTNSEGMKANSRETPKKDGQYVRAAKIAVIAILHICPRNKWFFPIQILRKFNTKSGHRSISVETLSAYLSIVVRNRLDPNMIRERRGMSYRYKYIAAEEQDVNPSFEEKSVDKSNSDDAYVTTDPDLNSVHAQDALTEISEDLCPECGKLNSSEANYCNWCGSPQGEEFIVDVGEAHGMAKLRVPRYVSNGMRVGLREYFSEHIRFVLDSVETDRVGSKPRVQFRIEVK